MKVGIAYAERLRTRWLEQGALTAVVLENMPDAYTARSLEERIHHTYNIKERITGLQKEQYLGFALSFCWGKYRACYL